MRTSANWCEQAIRFLQHHTDAIRDVIEHFVELGWDPDDSPEENLDSFELYRAEFAGAFT